MSHTDNTRPYSVQEGDPTLVRVRSQGHTPTHPHHEECLEYRPLIYGGKNSFRGHAKTERKLLRRKIRAHQRQALHGILHAIDREAADVRPIYGDRRCITWLLA